MDCGFRSAAERPACVGGLAADGNGAARPEVRYVPKVVRLRVLLGISLVLVASAGCRLNRVQFSRQLHTISREALTYCEPQLPGQGAVEVHATVAAGESRVEVSVAGGGAADPCIVAEIEKAEFGRARQGMTTSFYVSYGAGRFIIDPNAPPDPLPPAVIEDGEPVTEPDTGSASGGSEPDVPEAGGPPSAPADKPENDPEKPEGRDLW